MSLSVLNSLEVPKPSHWPVPMARYGIVPTGAFKGDPIYRVVFAPTVRKLVFGQFADGYIGARPRKAHPAIGNKWIIEKWISGFEDTKQTPAEYEQWGPRDPQSGMLINGPYPYDGTYNHCWTFEGENPEPGSIEKIIFMIQRGANRTAEELRAGNAELDAKEEREAAEKRFLRCRETEPLYGVRPASFAGHPKTINHKSQKTPIAANDLGLPTRRGSVVSMKGPQVQINGGI